MKVLRVDNITEFDVDNTLVIWPKNNPNEKKPGTIAFEYGDEIVYLYPHKPHIRFLKHCFVRGDYVEVWSLNGFLWAEQVIKKLKIQKYVSSARAKASRHVDDTHNIEEIVGGRIFMKYDPEE